jgi:hypothetical protein
MRSDEYSRLRAAFLAMAEQTDLPDVRERWLVLALETQMLAEKGLAAKDLRDRLEWIRALRSVLVGCAAQHAATFLAESVSAESTLAFL